MADRTTTQAELLLEAQRTTHAVSAIGRFLILQVTYSVIALITIGPAIAAGGGALGGILLFGGGVTVITELVHSLTACLSELSLSDRPKRPDTSKSDRWRDNELYR